MSKVTKTILLIGAMGALAGSIWIARYFCKTFPEQIGLVASIATLIGLAYTVIQLWETKTLTRATKESADKAVLELRGSDYRSALLLTGRLLGEIRTYVQNRDWRIAAIRLHDLADQCLSLARMRPGVDDQWRGFSKVVRWWGGEFASGRRNRPFKYEANEWQELFDRLWDKIDKESQPFTQGDDR